MANTIKLELQKVRDAGGGKMLLAEQVVKWARAHRTSELHKKFEWDDRKAADEYRLWQARQIIQLYFIDQDSNPTMVSLSIDRRNKGGGYREVNDVLTDAALTQVMLGDALAELERVQARYNRVKALAAVWDAVESVKKKSRPRVAA